MERDDTQGSLSIRLGEQLGGLVLQHPQLGSQPLRLAGDEAADPRRQATGLTDLSRPRVHLVEDHSVQDAHVIQGGIGRWKLPHEFFGDRQSFEDPSVILTQGFDAGQQANLLDAFPVKFGAAAMRFDHCLERAN